MNFPHPSPGGNHHHHRAIERRIQVAGAKAASEFRSLAAQHLVKRFLNPRHHGKTEISTEMSREKHNFQFEQPLSMPIFHGYVKFLEGNVIIYIYSFIHLFTYSFIHLFIYFRHFMAI